MSLVTRRQILKGLLSASAGAVGASALAACGATPGGAPPATGATTTAAGQPAAAAGSVPVIDWWSSWGGDAFPMIEKAFNDSHDDCQVKWVNVPSEITSKLFSAVASGDPPDVVYNIIYNEWMARGLMIPLDDYIATSDEVSLTDGDIPAEVFEMFSWQGEFYGIPVGGDNTLYSMGYNLRVVEEAGLDPDQLPETWDEVFEWHRAMTTYDDAGNIDVLGYAPTMDSSASAHGVAPWVYPQMWGFDYFDPDTLEYDIDRPETIELLEEINRFWQDVGPEKIGALGKSMEGQSRGAFGAGKQGMYISYASGAAGVHATNPDDTYKWSWVPVPSSRRGQKVVTVGGHATTIMKGAKNPDAAFKLCVFNSQKEACDILFDNFGWVSVRRSYQDTLDLSKYPDHVADGIWFFVRTQLEEGTDIKAVADPVGLITDQEWKSMREAVIYGDLGAKEAAQRMQARMTEEIANWKAEQTSGS